MAGVKVRATKHAVERYHDRVRPGLSLRAAEAELVRACSHGELTEKCPDWAHEHEAATAKRRYLMLGDDICLVLEPHTELDWVIVTVLTRSGLSPEARARRNKRAHHKRHRRRMKRRKR